MSQLKALRNQITNVGQANKLCHSMSNLSTIRTFIYSNKLKTARTKLELLGGILFRIGSDILPTHLGKKTFVFFSDFGFCGEFNEHRLNGACIPIGKKGKSVVQTNDLQALSLYIKEKTLGNYNFEFLIKDFTLGRVHKFMPKDFLRENTHVSANILLEYDYENLLARYFQLFLDFVFYYGQLQENLYRSKIMKNAVDNSKKWLDELKINANKIRQMSITNEILLIVSCQGGNV